MLLFFLGLVVGILLVVVPFVVYSVVTYGNIKSELGDHNA